MLIENFFPNPSGKDTDSEYITLRNDASDPIDLVGWTVADAAGKSSRLSGLLGPGQELVLPYSTTKIPLNNNGETVKLIDASGEVVDMLSYTGQAAEGEIISRVRESGTLQESDASQYVSADTDVLVSSTADLSLVVMLVTAAVLAAVSVWVLSRMPQIAANDLERM